MKKYIIILIAVLISLSIQAQKKTKTTEVKIKTSAVCEMCKKTIEKTLAYEKGVKKANLNVETKTLTVVFSNKKTNIENIRKTINNVGYDADDSPANKEAYNKLHYCCKKE